MEIEIFPSFLLYIFSSMTLRSVDKILLFPLLTLSGQCWLTHRKDIPFLYQASQGDAGKGFLPGISQRKRNFFIREMGTD